MKRVFLFLFIMTFASILVAQTTISGYIKDYNGEPIHGANVFLKETGTGTVSEQNGHFVLRDVPSGNYTLTASFVGYTTWQKTITVKSNNLSVNIVLNRQDIVTDEVTVYATRANEKTPMAFLNVEKSDIERNNNGKDLPYIIKLTPSVVVSSDAGAGVGYTAIRIRGTDPTRINVTINGVPLNDPESQGTYWVDIPDFASSLQNIQIQRGVGTSTNGAAAFGATINLQTNALNPDAYGKVDVSAGSFNTHKETVSVGSGLINSKFTFDIRLSNIHSDGYIDRAFSNMKSFFTTAAYRDKKNLLRVNVFSGTEETYQAWYGVPKVRLLNDTAGMQRYADHWLMSQDDVNRMMKSEPRTFNYYTYKNEIDHYEQSHYQIFYTRKVFDNLNVNMALHYTKGAGYYEQYKKSETLAEYGINNITIGNQTITETDLIRRKWLDNDFYGIVFSSIYRKTKFNFTIGGAANMYQGWHFGKIRWMRFAGDSEIDHEWYRNKGTKRDANVYAKANLKLGSLNLFADLQYRHVDYSINGVDDYLDDDGSPHKLDQWHVFDFFNPKAGFSFDLRRGKTLYMSFAIAHREPSRADFIDAPVDKMPEPETLWDFETGVKMSDTRWSFNTNFYYMFYINQLVHTGMINDVGTAIMVNVPVSYRAGVEFETGLKFSDRIQWNANLTLSRNKIVNYEGYVDDWDTGTQRKESMPETNLSFSPEVVAASIFSIDIIENFNAQFISKYVGRQYIDNTSNIDRSLDPYLVSDIKISYEVKPSFARKISLSLSVNNVFNTEYETYAWVYRYYFGGKHYTMDGYFPQAGINYLLSLSLKF